jgi:hypothetical protein
MSTDFSLQGSFGFDPEPVCLKHVVEKAALKKRFTRLHQFSSVSIIAPLFHVLYPSTTLTMKDKRAKQRNLQTNQYSFGHWTALVGKFLSHCFSLHFFQHFRFILNLSILCPFTVVNNSSLKQIKFLQTRSHLYLKLNVTDALTYGNLAHTHR